MVPFKTNDVLVQSLFPDCLSVAMVGRGSHLVSAASSFVLENVRKTSDVRRAVEITYGGCVVACCEDISALRVVEICPKST